MIKMFDKARIRRLADICMASFLLDAGTLSGGVGIPKANAEDSTEFICMEKDITLDSIMGKELTSKAGLFVRGITKMGYDENVDYYGVFDFSHDLFMPLMGLLSFRQFQDIEV